MECYAGNLVAAFCLHGENKETKIHDGIVYSYTYLQIVVSRLALQ